MVPAMLMLADPERVIPALPPPTPALPLFTMVILPVPVMPPEMVMRPLSPLLVSVNPEDPTVIAPLTLVDDPLVPVVTADLISVTLDPTVPVMLSVETLPSKLMMAPV